MLSHSKTITKFKLKATEKAGDSFSLCYFLLQDSWKHSFIFHFSFHFHQILATFVGLLLQLLFQYFTPSFLLLILLLFLLQVLFFKCFYLFTFFAYYMSCPHFFFYLSPFGKSFPYFVFIYFIHSSMLNRFDNSEDAR